MKKLFTLLFLVSVSAFAFGQPLYKISQIKGYNATTGVADSLKTYCKLKGIVSTPDLSTAGVQFAIYDNTGAIYVTSTKTLGYKVKRGDSLMVTGTIIQASGVTELRIDTSKTTSIKLISSGHKLKAAKTVTVLNESTESDLVRIANLTLKYPKQWDTTGNNKKGVFYAIASNGVDSFTIKVDRQTNLWGKPAPSFAFHITGIGLQTDTKAPLLDFYTILPRDTDDIVSTTYIPPTVWDKIKDVITNDSIGLPKHNGDLCQLRGLVLSEDFNTNGGSFFIQDTTGATHIYHGKKTFGYTPKRGDSVMVHGKISSNRGLIEVNPDTIVKISGGNTLPSPNKVIKLAENTESQLIALDSLIFYDISKWTKGIGTGGFTLNAIRANHKTDTIAVRIDNDVDLYNLNIPTTGEFNIIGLGIQLDNTSPYTSNYQIMPRNAADIISLSKVVVKSINLYNINQIKSVDATTGIADSANVRCFLVGVVHSPDMGIANISFALKDMTGAITCFHQTKSLGYTPKIGDSIKVRGIVNQVQGLTRFTMDSTVIVLGKGQIQTSKAVVKLDESTESDIVSLAGLSLVDSKEWDSTKATGNYFNVRVSNASNDTFNIRILKTVDSLFHSIAPSGKLTITGIAAQQDITSPYFEGYYLYPRMVSDIATYSGIENTVSVNQINIYPNPSKEILNINSSSKIISVLIFDMAGRKVLSSNQSLINIENLPKGIYQLQVKTLEGRGVKKLVRE
ncbi:MAG: T9SS type A sorting domain-containing protein [Bacteroidetes bacterium]|nr:T9SS type A sorting domain-containing protein [Bacteroidota bacterium]